MSAYANFAQDFPLRCGEILDDYERKAEHSGREVTLTLAIASAAFVIPFERLNPSNTDHIAHERHEASIRAMGQLLGKPFGSVYPGESWCERPAIAGPMIRGKYVEDWLNPELLKPIEHNRQVGSVLAVVRNALAHGNLYSCPNVGVGPIERLIFLSKRRNDVTREMLDEYNVVAVAPSDFTRFLRSWLTFLEGIDLPSGPVQATYMEWPEH